MDTPHIDKIFIERKFELHNASGEVSHVRLCMGEPQQKADDWSCQFQIMGIGDETIQASFGIDSLHSFLIGLKLAHALLKYLARYEQKKITWLNNDDLGFSIE